MALGRQPQERQQEFWVACDEMPRSPGHPFYHALNRVLDAANFDQHAEELCEPYYATGGRPSIPPGRYFRMLFVGYFEGINSQRGIAWRCSDSLSLREFLKLAPDKASPDHSSLSRIRQRLPLDVHTEIFLFVLEEAARQGLLNGKTVAVDATTLEANAAMKSIVRIDSGEDWNEYLRKLAEEDGIEDPSDEDLRRFDKKRQGKKKVSNQDWESPSDPDSRIVRMKDGRTHLAYKAENVVDLDTELILAAEIYEGDAADTNTMVDSVMQARVNLSEGETETGIEEAAADKGYHSAKNLELCESLSLRTYIPEPERNHRRKWKDKPVGYQRAVYNNRRRVRGNRSKQLQRRRSEVVERSFAHMCETGGARRTWLRGLEEVHKRWLIQAAARNLGLIMRKLIGVGTPKGLWGVARALFWRIFGLMIVLEAFKSTLASIRLDFQPSRAAGNIVCCAA